MSNTHDVILLFRAAVRLQRIGEDDQAKQLIAQACEAGGSEAMLPVIAKYTGVGIDVCSAEVYRAGDVCKT